jgi:hypothetical protein
MAKGQIRGNKETKKPKQDKKTAAPASTFGNAAAQASSQINDAKKK